MDGTAATGEGAYHPGEDDGRGGEKELDLEGALVSLNALYLGIAFQHPTSTLYFA